MSDSQPIKPAARLLLVLLLATTGSAQGVQAEDQSELHRLRAERRAATRATSLAADKSAVAGRFALLVIPVDFLDTRLPADWDNQDLAARLVPDQGETLHNYFRIASGGRLDLDITLAPVVHLQETRRLYSDRDLNGFTRTRKMATESLTAIRDLGYAFRRFDNDGADGIAGTADDDGFVDGVLILHAGVGNENDPDEGLIQALQFFLEDPVVDQGVAASFYAVASLHSGPGIWAHETAHLLGLEDRYDPLLHPAGESEVRSRGGLGRFSLMAAGAWGTGEGYGAALPDAYSSSLLGWYRVRNLMGDNLADSLTASITSGEVARLWTGGAAGPEFFLLEVRDPVASAPFDAGVPGGHMLIYHVDENVPEGNWLEESGGGYHLRVHLLEADADPGLRNGLDEGRAEDLYPGPLDNNLFALVTVPSSASYYGTQSKVSLSEIDTTTTGVRFDVSVNIGATLTFDYSFVGGQTPLQLELAALETGMPFATLSCRISTIGSAHGFFVNSAATEVEFALIESEPGTWIPAETIFWELYANTADGTGTFFNFSFSGETASGMAGGGGDQRIWIWSGNGSILDFRTNWPGAWMVLEPGRQSHSTTWQRWDSWPWLTGNQNAVLACVAQEFTTSDFWPNVTYGNSGHTTLTSAPLAAPIAGVRLTHAVETEMLTGLTAMDGGAVVWVGPDDLEIPATPVGGYGGRIAAKSVNVLHGRDAFVGAGLILAGDVPQWRTDTFLLPSEGPGPWRLRLVFGSNTLWRARGWFIAEIEALVGEPEVTAFLPSWDGDLHWRWPWRDAGDPWFAIETRSGDLAPWVPLLEGLFEPEGVQTYGISGTRILAALTINARHRHQIRVIGRRPVGEVASSAIVIYPDGGDGAKVLLGEPWPNPSAGLVRFQLEVPVNGRGILKIYDLRGRRVQTLPYGPGQHLALWDGRDQDGVRVAAGIYYLRLEGSGPVLTRKVVLIH